MGTHQQNLAVPSSTKMTTPSTEDQLQFHSAPSVGMDFASIYNTTNPNETFDMDLFGLTDFGDDRELWGINNVNTRDGIIDLAAEQPTESAMTGQMSAASLPQNDLSYGDLANEFLTTAPQHYTIQKGQQHYQKSIQELFPLEQSIYDHHNGWPTQEGHLSTRHPDFYIPPFQAQALTEVEDTAWVKPKPSESLSSPENCEEEDSSDGSDPCYAQLLYRCLKEAPDQTMTLKDVYEWVARNSRKAGDSSNRGWQNSVRHNLSMNKAFERVSLPTNQGQKKGSLWRLTEKALREGVISTTRFRKDPKRKPERRSSPAPKRQASGARGGQATRRAANARYAKLQKSRQIFSPVEIGHSYNQRGGSPLVDMYPTSHVRLSPPHSNLYAHTAPTSPYFIDPRGQTPSFTSNPVTPPPMQLNFGGDAKHFLPQYNFQHIDFSHEGLFGNRDDVLPGTPSLASETSMPTDDSGHALSHHASRENTFDQ